MTAYLSLFMITILQATSGDDLAKYVSWLIGALIFFQLQRIVVKFNTLIRDNALFNQWMQTTEKKVEKHETEIDNLKEKQSDHEGKIREIQRKVF